MTKDREIGALPWCRAVSAWAKHPRGSALPNGRTCCHMFPSNALELRILQLYVWALNSSRIIDGCRTAPVARYGANEVRFVEPLLVAHTDNIHSWIDLFDLTNA